MLRGTVIIVKTEEPPNYRFTTQTKEGEIDKGMEYNKAKTEFLSRLVPLYNHGVEQHNENSKPKNFPRLLQVTDDNVMVDTLNFYKSQFDKVVNVVIQPPNFLTFLLLANLYAYIISHSAIPNLESEPDKRLDLTSVCKSKLGFNLKQISSGNLSTL
jgi:hypothetical protein